MASDRIKSEFIFWCERVHKRSTMWKVDLEGEYIPLREVDHRNVMVSLHTHVSRSYDGAGERDHRLFYERKFDVEMANICIRIADYCARTKTMWLVDKYVKTELDLQNKMIATIMMDINLCVSNALQGIDELDNDKVYQCLGKIYSLAYHSIENCERVMLKKIHYNRHKDNPDLSDKFKGGGGSL